MAVTINGTTGIAGVDGSASTPAVQGTDTNTGIFFGTDTVTIATGGTTAVTVDSGQRTKFPTTIGVGGATPAASGVGITFPATASASSDANTLDDYEEGTFTPEFANGASSTYAFRIGRYTKIGNTVSFSIDIELTNQSGTSGGAQISGLPFTSTNMWQGVGVVNGDNNWTTSRSNLGGAVATSSTTISIWYGSGSNLVAVNISDLGNTGRIVFGGTYRVA